LERYKIQRAADREARGKAIEELRFEVERLSALSATRRDEIKRLATELDAKRDALTETVADLRVARERLTIQERSVAAKPK